MVSSEINEKKVIIYSLSVPKGTFFYSVQHKR